jgi:hypothetical protein
MAHTAPYRAESHFVVAKKPGQGAHLDAFGPLRTHTLGGNKYGLIITDSYSGFHVLYLFNNKSEQAGYLAKYLTWSFSQTSNKMQWVRGDGEWGNNAEVKALITKHGFELKMTNRNHPQSNGLAERSIGIITEKARIQLLLSRLPDQFYGESLMSTVRSKSFTPKYSLSG